MDKSTQAESRLVVVKTGGWGSELYPIKNQNEQYLSPKSWDWDEIAARKYLHSDWHRTRTS